MAVAAAAATAGGGAPLAAPSTNGRRAPVARRPIDASRSTVSPLKKKNKPTNHNRGRSATKATNPVVDLHAARWHNWKTSDSDRTDTDVLFGLPF